MKHVGGAKPILYVAMIVVLLSTFLVVATPVTAQADTGIHWQGWWAGDHVINSATVGQTVTAKVRLVGYPAGDYRIRIRRDRSDLRLDVDIATDEFYYDGGDHTYSMDFVPATATGVDWTEGYHVDVYIDVVLWGWAELWTLDNAYPPRLQVHDANRIVWPAIGSPAIQTKGSTLTIEVAEDDDLSTDKAQWTATIKKGHRNIEVTKDPTTDAETTTDNGTDYYLEYVLEVTDVARLSSAGGNGWYSLDVEIPSDLPEFSRDLLFDLVVSPLGFGEKTAYNSVQVIEAFSADPTFITLTDTHIGFPGHPGIPGTPWPPAPNIDEMSKLKQEIDEINLIHPDFVVITGDLVDYGGSTEDHENWEDFENLLRLFEVPVYTVTGNHDWYADDVPCIRPEDDELDAMGYYFRNISPYMDYTFDYGDLHAVCLNSGYQGALLGSGSSGLEDLQIEWLSDDLAGNPDSFIFLHHPVVRAGGIEEHTLFTNNREEFMTVCENNAVEAVFSGHDHSDEHISESGVDYYLTRSATRSNEDNGYRIIRPTGSGAHEEMVLDNYNESLGEYNLNLTYSPLDWDVGTAETLHATIVNRHTGKAHLSSDLFPDMLLKFIMPRGSYEVSATTSPSIWTPEPEDADCEIIAQTDYADRSLLHVIVDVRDAEPTQVNPFEWEYLTTVNVTVSPVEEPTSAVDVVLIIDSSGSMGWNDPGNKRLEAARAYLTASLEGDHVGVVDFDGYVRVASDLRRLPDEKTSLIAAINTINSSGATNIGRGIQAGCDVLLASTSGNAVKAAILLTDGQGSFSGQDECFKSRGWPIYTFGFGDANRALLQQIASNTGGEYTDLPTSDFVCEFQRVRAKIAGVEPGPCTAMHIDPIETETFFAAVPPSMAIATFSTSWIGSDVVMTLTTPSGRVVDRSTVAPDVIHDKGAAFETYTILNPEPGDWQVDLFGADVPPGGEEVVFGMSTVPALNAPPVADADGPYAAEVGVAVNVRGSFNDPDFLDTHTATWDWGDTTTSAGTVTEVGGSGNVTGSHTYECLGVYTITLAVTDDDGDVGTATTTVTVEPRPMDSFNVNNLTVRWYTNGGPLRPDTFGIRGTLELPDGYWADDLIKEAEVTVAIGGEVGIDNVSDFTEYRPPSRWPQTVRWYYSGNEQPPGDGINITRMTINFPPEGTDWSGWPNFEIVGQLELPDHVGPGTEPPEVTVTLEIQATPCGSVIGGDTVLSRVYRFMGYWYNWTYRE